MCIRDRLRIMLYSKFSTKNLMISLGLAQPEAQSGCPVAITYSKSDIYKLLSHFKINKIKKDHIFPYQIDKYRQYVYVKKFPWNIIPIRMFHFIESVLGWHCLIQATYLEENRNSEISPVIGE